MTLSNPVSGNIDAMLIASWYNFRIGDLTKLEKRRAQSRASYHRRKKPQVLSDHLCECGCGEFTYLAPKTSAEKGWIKDKPKRFIRGHHRRLYNGPVSEARCRICSSTKPAAEFYNDTSRPTGLSSGCRDCLKAKTREKYKADPDYYLSQAKRWREENPKRSRELAKNARYRRRTRIKNGVIEKVDIGAIYKRDGGKCHICGKRVAKKDMSLDHLIPISKGGDHVVLNVRLAHTYCNVKRGAGRIPAQLLLH